MSHHRIHPALSRLTEPKFVELIEDDLRSGNCVTVCIRQFSISLYCGVGWEQIRFYDECRNNFATIDFNGEFTECYIYSISTDRESKEKLFNSLESMSDSFVEWLLWNPIL